MTFAAALGLFLVSVSASIIVILLLTIIGRRASLILNTDFRRVFLLLVVTTPAFLRKCTYGQDAKHHDHQ